MFDIHTGSPAEGPDQGARKHGLPGAEIAGQRDHIAGSKPGRECFGQRFRRRRIDQRYLLYEGSGLRSGHGNGLSLPTIPRNGASGGSASKAAASSRARRQTWRASR